MPDSNHLDVLNFHRQLELPVGQMPQFLSDEEMQQRIDFLEEELQELKDAVKEFSELDPYHTPQEEWDRVMGKIFDCLLDINYVSHGTAVMMGLPWQMGWEAIQDANMQKVRDRAQDTEHHRGVIKPPGWQHPDMGQLIARYRAIANRASHPVRPPVSNITEGDG